MTFYSIRVKKLTNIGLRLIHFRSSKIFKNRKIRFLVPRVDRNDVNSIIVIFQSAFDRKIKVKLTNHQACHCPKNQSMYIALVCTSVWAYRTNIIIVDVVYTDLKIIRDHLASFLVNQYHTHFRRSLFLIDLAKKGSKLNQFSIKRHFQNLISKCSGTFINSYFKM